MDFDGLKFDMSQASMKAGHIAFRTYTLKRQLRHGLGLETWLAREEDKKRTVALVFLPNDIFQNIGVLDEIDKEIQDCSQLDHPNLVHVHRLIKDKKAAAVDIQYVEGDPIFSRSASAPNACLEVKAISLWMGQLCHALSYAHRRTKYPHGSLGPAKLLITPAGVLRLSGIGLSRLSGQLLATSEEKSSEVLHQSPQQALGQDAAISDDIYAIGSIIYELLTSKPPFHDGDVLNQLASEVPPSMMERRKELGIKGKSIPRKWEEGVAACLAKAPEDRPRSVAELAEKFDLPPTDSEHPPVAADEKKAVITKFRVVVASFILVVLVILAVGGWWLGGLVQTELKRQAEVKRIETEERERAIAAKKAANLAEKERLKQEAEAEAKAAADEVAEQKAREIRQKEEERLALARGGLMLETNPSGATITVGQEDVLQSPAQFDSLRLGRHTLTVEKKGYETIKQEIEIKEDQVIDLGRLELTRETGRVSMLSKPAGATVFKRGKAVGKTPLIIEKEPTGKVNYFLKLDGYLSSEIQGQLTSSTTLELVSELEKRSGPLAGKSWENDLGMKFQQVNALNVLFSVYETRVQDFGRFVEETGYRAEGGMRSLENAKWGQYGHTWKNPGFKQGAEYPVVGVSWKDAKAFCKWLTERDQENGVLNKEQYYRLPTDLEWSVAVQLRENAGGTPEQKNGVNDIQYPWGTQWPPPEEAGNYAGYEAQKSNWPKKWKILTDYRDTHARTSPVGSFRLKRYGLFDMSGNVLEWCEDPYKPGDPWRVLRGGSWSTNRKDHLLSSHREYYSPDDRYSFIGFRVVVSY